MILSELLKDEAVPTSVLDEWRYTPVRKILAQEYAFDEPILEIKEDSSWFDPRFYNFIFINGFFQKDLSHSGQLNFSFTAEESLKSHFQEDDYFMKISQNMARNELDFSVQHSPKRPVRFLFITSPTKIKHCSLPRLNINVAANVKVSFVEQFRESEREGLSIELFSVKIKDAAQVLWVSLNFNKISGEKNQRLHYLNFDVGNDANLEHYFLCFGAQFVRSRVRVTLAEQAKVALKSANLLTQAAHVDLQTEVFHRAKNSSSDQNYRTIVTGKSKFIFRGKIHIAHAANNSSAKQKNHNIKFSSESEIDTQPILNIDCNEVQCSHGATVSALREEDIFYMQSRGISAEKAKVLLAHSFLAEPLITLEDRLLKDLITDLIKDHDELLN